MMPFLKLTPESCRRMWIKYHEDQASQAWLLLSGVLSKLFKVKVDNIRD